MLLIVVSTAINLFTRVRCIQSVQINLHSLARSSYAASMLANNVSPPDLGTSINAKYYPLVVQHHMLHQNANFLLLYVSNPCRHERLISLGGPGEEVIPGEYVDLQKASKIFMLFNIDVLITEKRTECSIKASCNS